MEEEMEGWLREGPSVRGPWNSVEGRREGGWDGGISSADTGVLDAGGRGWMGSESSEWGMTVEGQEGAGVC